MPIANTEIARLFQRYATLLEIRSANTFRVPAYRNAARTIENLPQSVAGMLAEGCDLAELAGIGEDLAAKIGHIVESGVFAELEELQTELPGGLAAMRFGIDQTRRGWLGPADVLNTRRWQDLEQLWRRR